MADIQDAGEIQFQCSNCNQLLEVANEHRGKSIACPKCSTNMLVPVLPVAKAVEAPKVQMIERTAKRYKGRLVIATLLGVIGVILLIIGSVQLSTEENPSGGVSFGLGLTMCLFAAIWGIAIRIRIWWHHE